MTQQIRRVGIGLLIGFVAVFLQLNYLQIFAAERIASNNANVRSLLREYSIKRGSILTLDGKQIAVSRSTGEKLDYLRTYPGGEAYGHITGFYSIVYDTSRIERTYDDVLLGEGGVISMQDIQDRLFDTGEKGDNVRLTVDSRLQSAAQAALGDEQGAIVAIDPNNGEVRAMWSNPGYDPSPLASHTAKEAKRYWKSLDPKSSDTPLISRSTSRGYPPGSTFKVVTAAAALESGRYNAKSTFDDPEKLELPLTDNTLTNFTHRACTGTGRIDLFTALRISCDTTFAKIGLKIHDEILDVAEKLGFNAPIPLDVGTVASTFPDVPDEDAPLRAYAAIGQGDTQATPLQMALVAATVANGGEVPHPRLVREVIDPSGGVVERISPETLGRAFSSETAATLTDMMTAVVESGTGTAAQIPGVPVAGKTGTAQTVKGENPHTWFICFAPADDPQLAVAVIVENGGSFGSEATGGAVAAPLAKRILEADRELRHW